MIDKVEEVIINWLKSDNENATELAYQICLLFDGKILELNARCKRHQRKQGIDTYNVSSSGKDKC